MSAGLAGGVGSWPSSCRTTCYPSSSTGSRARKSWSPPSPSFQTPYQQRLPEDLLSSSWKNSPFCGQPTAVCTLSVKVCADRPGQSRPWQRRACVRAEQSRPGQRLASSATPWPGSETRRPAPGWVSSGEAPPPPLLHSPETVPLGAPHPPTRQLSVLGSPY